LLYGVDRSAVEGELKTLLKGAACVSYGEPDFWRKLRGLLPIPPGFRCTLQRKVNRSDNRSSLVQAYETKEFGVLPLGVPLAMQPSDSSSPTCSTVMSDSGSDGLPPVLLNPGRLEADSQPFYSSCSYSQPSEHTYQTIPDQYQTAGHIPDQYQTPGHIPDQYQGGELYSTLESEVRPHMPSDPDHPGHHHERSLSHSLWV